MDEGVWDEGNGAQSVGVTFREGTQETPLVSDHRVRGWSVQLPVAGTPQNPLASDHRVRRHNTPEPDFPPKGEGVSNPLDVP